MKPALTIGLMGAALAATLALVPAGSPTPELVTEANAAPPAVETITIVPNYQRGPLIIHVPQAGNDHPGSRASLQRPPSHNDDDDDEVAPPRRNVAPPPVRATPRWAPRTETPPPSKPRVESAPKASNEPPRRVRHIDMSKPERRVDEPPPPPGPRRAVLSAPPPPAEGPSPIKPLPRYDAATPPSGYTPPTALPPPDEETKD